MNVCVHVLCTFDTLCVRVSVGVGVLNKISLQLHNNSCKIEYKSQVSRDSVCVRL